MHRVIFTESDVVSIHVPLTPETEGLIGKKQLSLMKPSTVLINTARAKIVDGHALYNTLVKGQIKGAAFDVYYDEPLPNPESDTYKLMSLPTDKFILTPHNAANSPEAMKGMSETALENVIDCLEGKTPKNKVN